MRRKGKMSQAEKAKRRERRTARRRGRQEKAAPQVFNASEQVRFRPHRRHFTPPILYGRTGHPGYVVEERENGLYLVQFDRIKPCIQVHADQLELVE